MKRLALLVFLTACNSEPCDHHAEIEMLQRDIDDLTRRLEQYEGAAAYERSDSSEYEKNCEKIW